MKEYKLGLSASKFSLLLNQFFINANNFISTINEILLNNYPINYFELIFENLDDINLKFHFNSIALKLGSQLNTTTKFLIFPKGFFFSHFRSNLWLNICDKYLYIFFVTNKLIKNFNYGLTLILIVYYLNKLLNLKLINFINQLKFYTKDERLESIGNYYQFLETSFSLYCRNYCKISKNEHYFDYENIIDNFENNLGLEFYFSFFNKKSNLIINQLNLFEL